MKKSKRIRYKTLYYPYGQWVDGNKEVVLINSNFRCKYHGLGLACILTKVTSKGGHGEPSCIGIIPEWINEETLEPVEVHGYVELY